MVFGNEALTIEDFSNSGWHEVIDQAAAKEFYAYSSGFQTRAKEAADAGDRKREEVYAILLAAIDAHLEPGREGELFVPKMEWEGKRTLLPDDIPDMHLDVLRELAPTIADPELRARIADILWVRRRDHQMAALAVDAYLEVAQTLEHPESWIEGLGRAHRALQIAPVLGRNGPHLQRATAYVDDLIYRAVNKGPEMLPARAMDVLLRCRQGDPVKYAAIASAAATEAETHHNWEIADDYWTISARWHARNNDPDAERAAKVNAAEAYVKLAAEFANTTPPSHLSATAQLERAIVAYRRIGHSGQRIEELRIILDDYQRKSMAEMRSHSIELKDVDKMAEQAMSAVKGQPLDEAIRRLALGYHPPAADTFLALARDLSTQFPLQFFVSRVHVDDAGRPVGRDRGGRAGGAGYEALAADVVRVAQTQQSLVTQTIIEAARYQIVTEHYVTREALVSLVTNNPFVPPGHEEIFLRGLLAGFRDDFVVAAHLLVPQIEQSIRYMLELNGLIPYGLNDDMIQDAYLLHELLWMPATTQVLGADIVFDLKVLLISRDGTNLRNRSSHGLMQSEEFDSWASTYVWWLVLHLCYVCLIVARHQPEPESEEQQGTSSGNE